jgi:hypothetical protein
MKNITCRQISVSVLLALFASIWACAAIPASSARAEGALDISIKPPFQLHADQQPPKDQQSLTGTTANGSGSFTIEQTLSDEAQKMTIAFDGLAFLTGNLGADSFFPPGKVADFWGFQYLRDNDPSEMGHNTDFLTKASLNMLNVLSTSQKTQLIALAKSQVDSINEYGYKRFVLMTAFRRLLVGDLPAGTNGLDEEAIRAFSSELYRLDGEISLERAQVMGNIRFNLNAEQEAYLANMVGKGMTSWPDVGEPADLRSLSHDEKVAVMTYAGDLFSWYAGSLEADVYFCPERQGTYFGSFYMKDAPSVGNPGYNIGTNITADMGKAFIAALTAEQAQLITGLVDTQRPYLYSIVDVRTQISTELRKFMTGETSDSMTVLSLMETYGELDGSIVYNFASNFVKIGQTLSDAQKTQMLDLRHQTLGDFTPIAAYLYATPIDFPVVPNTDFLFGSGSSIPVMSASDGAYLDRVEVSWSAVNGATSYLVYRSDSLSGTKIPPNGFQTSALGGADQWEVPGFTYYYWVKACTGSVCGDFSTPETGWQRITPPVITASDGSDRDKIPVSWTASSGATSYLAFRSGAPTGRKLPAGGYLTTGLSGADIWADPGFTYYYWVKACNDSNCSDFSAYDTGWR